MAGVFAPLKAERDVLASLKVRNPKQRQPIWSEMR